MSFTKLGEAVAITTESIQSADSVAANPAIMEQFRKMAADLKTIAPKAEDFLYFSAIMMHAAEAALLDEKGQIKKDAAGNAVTCKWEKSGDSWKWACSDANIKPHRNSNRDIFPEEELLKAHKKWVGRPLCLDHQSSSVDMVRGLIVDTYYDFPNKRVIALCALDKVGYPQLARQVSTGYAASVSMGTAVGRAICSECGRVAKSEADFCDHMRSKSCYGEINTDLNPIELSIVVNGADPGARIRQIVAAADSMAKYVEQKESNSEKIDLDMLNKISCSLIGALGQLELMKKTAQSNEGEEKLQDSGLQDSGKTEKEPEKKPEPPKDSSKEEKEKEEKEEKEEKVATLEEDIKKISGVVNGILEKVTKLQGNISNLTKKETDNMTEKTAYFQGGGGANEPTPGTPKYEKEPMADNLRGSGDKQMVGQMDTGPVEGMYPGDAARKDELQRMAAEREQRRKEAVAAAKNNLKQGYFQGGGDVNEPTPGKPKYPKEDYQKNRDKQDKQMVGQKPFPDVGDVEGLYGDDEKVKKMLARAKLTARFIKASSPNGEDDKGKSCWQVYADNKLILSGTVKDIAGAQRVDALYDAIATEKFGRKILDVIRTEGFEKAEGMMKEAQPAPAPLAAPAPAPAPGGAPGADQLMPPEGGLGMEGMPLEGGPTDLGGVGDPADALEAAIQQVESGIADVRKGVEALTGQPAELEGLEQVPELGGGRPDMPGAPGAEMPQMPVGASLVTMQKKLGQAMLIGFKKAEAKLTRDLKELKMGRDVLANIKKLEPKVARRVPALIMSAVEDSKESMAEHRKLLEAFVKYAKGTEILVKRAQDENDAKKKGLPPWLKKDKKDDKKADDTCEKDEVKPDDAKADDKNDAVIKPDGSVEGTPVELGQVMSGAKKASEPDLTTKEGRAKFREELSKRAQTGVKFQDVLDEAHPQGGFTTQLDVKPEKDLAKVETLPEINKAMLGVALAPPKVRKVAEDIQKMVVSGKIDPSKDFDGLIANGLDSEAVKYWKQYYAQGDSECSQFSTELTKEHGKQKKAAENEQYQVKLARAYELSYDMVRKGMLADSRAAVSEQVGEIMKFNDDAFDSMKRWVDRQDTVKTASIPSVGMRSNGDMIVFPTPEASQSDLATELGKMWAGRKV